MKKKQIVVPVDGSEQSMKALDVALDLARQRGQGLLLMHVVPSGGMPSGMAKWASVEHIHESATWLYDQGVAENVLSGAEDRIADRDGVETERLIDHGDPAHCILEVSRSKDTAMIVMGSRGLSDFTGLVLGSVAHKVAHGAGCPVVTVT
jgi:nucleotide-binding universal stress UspA family protein